MSFTQVAKHERNEGIALGLARAATRLGSSWSDSVHLMSPYVEHRTARSMVGYVLAVEGEIEEARKTLDVDQSGGLWDMMTRVHIATAEGDVVEAEDWIKQMMRCYPGESQAPVLLLMRRLASGDISGARDVYAQHTTKIRRAWGHGNRCRQVAVKWQGEEVNGRRILLYCPVGYGDSFMFVRFVRYFAERGAQVVLESRKATAEVLSTCPGVERVIERYDPIESVDYEADLREVFLIADEPVAAMGYESPYLSKSLSAGEGVGSLRRSVPEGKCVIGLAWASSTGNGGHGAWTCKSMPLSTMLTAIPGGSIGVALQPWSQTLPPIVREPPIPLKTFAETACIIGEVDAIVSIDSAVAHLAGAMGKNVSIVVPKVTSWRWEQCSSNWYKRARVFRQEAPGDWENVVARVAKHLLI